MSGILKSPMGSCFVAGVMLGKARQGVAWQTKQTSVCMRASTHVHTRTIFFFCLHAIARALDF
jgi:hypothetical protein